MPYMVGLGGIHLTKLIGQICLEFHKLVNKLQVIQVMLISQGIELLQFGCKIIYFYNFSNPDGNIYPSTYTSGTNGGDNWNINIAKPY